MSVQIGKAGEVCVTWWQTMHHCNTEYWLLVLLSGYSPDWCHKQKNAISVVPPTLTVVISQRIYCNKEDRTADAYQDKSWHVCLKNCVVRPFLRLQDGMEWSRADVGGVGALLELLWGPAIQELRKRNCTGDLEIFPQKIEIFYSWGHRMGENSVLNLLH